MVDEDYSHAATKPISSNIAYNHNKTSDRSGGIASVDENMYWQQLNCKCRISTYECGKFNDNQQKAKSICRGRVGEMLRHGIHVIITLP